MKPTFWLSIVALLLMISGFLVQQAAQIPFVEQLVAGNTADARHGLDTLIGKSSSSPRDLGFGGNLTGNPSLSKTDRGFGGLAILYADHLGSRVPREARIERFVDARAFVPGPRGPVNLVVVQWSNGQQTDTSYEEIREIISKSFHRSLWPLQMFLFIIGVCVQVTTIAVTHFPRKRQSQLSNAETKKDDHGADEAHNRQPSES